MSDTLTTTRISVCKRYGPLAVLAVGLLAFWLLDLRRFASFEGLRANQEVLTLWVSLRPISSGVVVAVGYVLIVAFSLPIAALMTLMIGLFFGQIWGTVIVVVSGTLGALAVFTAARLALGSGLRGRAGPFMPQLQAGFQANAFSYMLILRLVPLFPFWLVNIVPAIFQVSTRMFVLTTAVGIVPGSFVFVGLGNGLGHILKAEEFSGLAVLVTPEVMMPLVLLAALSALPILYKLWYGPSGMGKDKNARS